MEHEYPFKRFSESETGEDIATEAQLILSFPEGARINNETLSIIRHRLADRLEEQWTDPKELLLADDSTKIVEALRSGGRVPDNGEVGRGLSQLLQDYRLTPDERDEAKARLFKEDAENASA